MRFAYFMIEHLPTRIETLRNTELSHHPLVVLRPWDSHVLDASPSAVDARVGAGDSLQLVEQLCPQATIISADESLYQVTHTAAEVSLDNFAGPVEVRGLGEFIVEISSQLSIFSTETDLTDQLLTQVQSATQLTPTIGIARNKFAAAQASRQAMIKTDRVLIVPNGKEKDFLAPLPLSTLTHAPNEMLRRLCLFGITTLGGFARLHKADVVHQFGPDLAIFHDLARGIDLRPLEPKSPPPMITYKANLPQPQSDLMTMLTSLGKLTEQLASTLQKGGSHATALTVTVIDEAGQEHATGAAVKPPAADVKKLRRIAGRLLEKLSLQSTATELRITAYPLREWYLGARQLTLFKTSGQREDGQMKHVLNSLYQRFGKGIIKLASTIEPPSPIPIQVRCHSDGTPTSLHICRSSRSRKIKRTHEYWRECWRWWDRPIIREYYQVEVNGGLIFTLFRNGRGHWFLDRRRA